jgi:hypothetical protein
MTFSVNYARTLIGGHSGLQAQAADLYMLKTTGEEYYNHLEYTHCHEFSAETRGGQCSIATASISTSPPARISAKLRAASI